MHQINLSDQLYEDVRRRSVQAGFASVEDYIADMLAEDLENETPDLAHFFTPERMALIRDADAGIDAGEFRTSAQAEAELAKSREEWLSRHDAGR